MKDWPKTLGGIKKAQEELPRVTSAFALCLKPLGRAEDFLFVTANLVSCAVLKRLTFNQNANRQIKSGQRSLNLKLSGLFSGLHNPVTHTQVTPLPFSVGEKPMPVNHGTQ